MEALDFDKQKAREKILELMQLVHRRSDGSTQIMAVTKGFPKEAAIVAYETGITLLGENYAQELIDKHSALDGLEIEWHMIGALQRNKVRKLTGIVSVWQTIDRLSLLKEIAKHHPSAKVLIQVNPMQIPNKSGCSMAEAETLLGQGLEMGLSVEGVMAVGMQGNLEETAKIFKEAVEFAERFDLPQRSIGMTEDLEVAIDHGSTLVRIGRALFGDRPNN
ncbi:MAG: Uncharacterised protein [Acidimicrobiales bacterium AG-410-I20]|nr:MAG: Uncharacterised protein [Acidimicrobiales bacterium AG-410-I20]